MQIFRAATTLTIKQAIPKIVIFPLETLLLLLFRLKYWIIASDLIHKCHRLFTIVWLYIQIGSYTRIFCCQFLRNKAVAIFCTYKQHQIIQLLNRNIPVPNIFYEFHITWFLESQQLTVADAILKLLNFLLRLCRWGIILCYFSYL